MYCNCHIFKGEPKDISDLPLEKLIALWDHFMLTNLTVHEECVAWLVMLARHKIRNGDYPNTSDLSSHEAWLDWTSKILGFSAQIINKLHLPDVDKMAPFHWRDNGFVSQKLMSSFVELILLTSSNVSHINGGITFLETVTQRAMKTGIWCTHF